MFRRWGEARMYRKTLQIAVAELRRAARTPNALDKLQALEVAEQKLRDALWLSPEDAKERFEGGLAEIQRSREKTLKDAALAVRRLLDTAKAGIGQREVMLAAAGHLLCFLNHYQPEDSDVEVLSARFRELGGQQVEYRPITPLSEIYHRPAAGMGCGSAIGGLVVVLVVCFSVLYTALS
jgi:hypothetical protein